MDGNGKPDLLSGRIAAAREGDIDAARSLIDEFCGTVRQNRAGGELGGAPLVPYTSFNERLLDYLVECFTSDTGVTLRPTVQGRRGRPASSDAHQESLARGQCVHDLLRVAKRVPGLLQPPDSFTVDKAIRFVAEGKPLTPIGWLKDGLEPLFAPKSEDAVKKGYQEWLALLKGAGSEREDTSGD